MLIDYICHYNLFVLLITVLEKLFDEHYGDVIMGTIASQITSPAIDYSTVYSAVDQRKHNSSASLAFVREFTGAGEFPAQMASNAENVSIWWRHHSDGGQKHCRLGLDSPQWMVSWWHRAKIVMHSVLLALCEGNKLQNDQSSCLWFETPNRSCHVTAIICTARNW